MKIVVIGGTGLIGSKVVEKLKQKGHEAIAAERLKEAMAGAQVVIDIANYTIIRSTQFLEFLGGIAASSGDGNIVRFSPGPFQRIAADDVAAIVADVALAGRHEAASSRSPARNERRSTRSSPAI
jgi:uncharacterized protein YbjT (DUF2867 family)